ncbi:siderophore-interacting protein [Mycolicibacter sp. MYC123]|uniref:Siderophore-interacting protein n=1 Tax=[Mycobacterium] zoologicum TaxID=2872311 RepID=A0ABU5YKJ8_9MYCO|nr:MULTISPECIES: siderophore-interacting protein [unclassified Mycolicibacter]MEB3050570.1 siderophore-interacting protein [Mycolicibacter sp. MYC123]MEB3063390.1 siderophore-interacting protein [Mycolicibacter sp. MYC101]
MATILDFPLVNTLRDALFLSATVGELEQLTPSLRRVRFAGPRLRGLAWIPGQHVRLQVAGLLDSVLRLHPHDALRTYSIYDADPDGGTLDIVMLDHGYDRDVVTPARRWATTVCVGDNVSITRPQGNFAVRNDAPYHLFAGEETASVAFAAMLRALPAGAAVHGVIEAADAAGHLPLARPLTHVERGEASAANSAVLADALRALELPDQPGVAYLAGEARTIQTLRKILITERGWDRRQIRTKPFWTPGRTGME